MGGVSVAADVGHLLGGAVLALSFVLLTQRRLTGAINAYAVQSGLLAAAASWQGWVQASPTLVLTGLIVLGGAGVALPLALHRIVRLLAIDRAMGVQPGLLAVLACGAALVVLAILLTVPVPVDGPRAAHEDLALALSVLLLGQLMMLVWRAAPAQLVGFLSMLSGPILGAACMRGMPLLAPFSAAALALAGATAGAVFVLRIRARFDDAEASGLDRLGRARR